MTILEDTGGGPRLVLYSPGSSEPPSRVLKADAESTLVIDVSKALQTVGDVALNRVLIRAELKKGNSSKPVEVMGYSQIGQSAATAASQTAFAFQTFSNVAGKLVNLYFTSRELIEPVLGQECYDALSKGESKRADARTACVLPADSTAKKEKLRDFESRLAVFTPEVEALASFFAGSENRAITAELATGIFEIDIESLQAIATQFKAERAKLAARDTLKDNGEAALETLLERSKLVVQDLSSVIEATRTIGLLRIDKTREGALTKLCPATMAEEAEGEGLRTPRVFARACYIEAQRSKYVAALRQYLVEGTIDLSKNDAEDGDLLFVTVEAVGPNAPNLGAAAQFRIRIANFGWKTGISESLLFVKRIGVNEADGNRPNADPVKSLQPVRFAPFPGFTFGASYHGQRKSWVPGSPYQRADGQGARIGRVLTPGFGVNVTFMTFGSRRDFDPSLNNGTGGFVTTTGSNFEVGVGPLVSLFNNRLSATFGWNLMASHRRQYWGLGFGFITIGRDVVRFFKKN